MANKSLTDLTARTATADSDLLHINSGGTDYKEQKNYFLKGSFGIEFENTSLLTSQIDALITARAWHYEGLIIGNGHQTETGLPEAQVFFVYADIYASTSKIIEIVRAGDPNIRYVCVKTSGGWGSWTQLPARSEITSLNNSLTNIGSKNVSHYAQHATSATMAYTGVSFTITKKSIVRADLYYTYSTPQEIAICGSSSGSQSFYANATAVANMTNVMLSCTALLDPGTFYVWARSGASANNNIGLYGIQIEP